MFGKGKKTLEKKHWKTLENLFISLFNNALFVGIVHLNEQHN